MRVRVGVRVRVTIRVRVGVTIRVRIWAWVWVRVSVRVRVRATTRATVRVRTRVRVGRSCCGCIPNGLAFLRLPSLPKAQYQVFNPKAQYQVFNPFCSVPLLLEVDLYDGPPWIPGWCLFVKCNKDGLRTVHSSNGGRTRQARCFLRFTTLDSTPVSTRANTDSLL